MKHPTRGLLRLAAFLLGLALIVAFANTFCIKTDIYAALTMAEVKARSTSRWRSSVPPSCATTSTPT
ncbi:MAG: hypothetical protein ACLUI3_04765 [Christensenellales bacterium]